MIRFHNIFLSMAALAAFCLTGCNPSPPSENPGPAADSHDAVDQRPEHPAGDEHAHALEGPHHGHIVELGNEAYHAELVHGAEGGVTIYILDSTATKPVPIDATEVTINTSHDGQAEQFKLPASPDAGDPAGKSSRFSLQNADLAQHLDQNGATAKLVLMNEGTQYTGTIEHSDHHDDHGHAL